MNSTITINYINFIGSNSIDVKCPICLENITDKCNKCNNHNDKTCYSVIGVCNHMFHYCCIPTTSNVCSLCNKKWELKRRPNLS